MLIIFSHLLAEIAAARMDDEIEFSVIVAVYFNKVIAAAQGSNATFRAARANLSVTA